MTALLALIVGLLVGFMVGGVFVLGVSKKELLAKLRRDATEGVSPGLAATLIRLGDDYGPMGVALVAAKLTDQKVLVRRLYAEADQPLPTREEPNP